MVNLDILFPSAPSQLKMVILIHPSHTSSSTLYLSVLLSLPIWFHSFNITPYKGGTKFASCFVCKQQGHLSKDCPENKHGIYPKVFHHTPLYLLKSPGMQMQDTEIRTCAFFNWNLSETKIWCLTENAFIIFLVPVRFFNLLYTLGDYKIFPSYF